MRALTEEVWVDECDEDEEGIADIIFDDNQIAAVPRPGTSFRTPTSHDGPSHYIRSVCHNQLV